MGQDFAGQVHGGHKVAGQGGLDLVVGQAAGGGGGHFLHGSHQHADGVDADGVQAVAEGFAHQPADVAFLLQVGDYRVEPFLGDVPAGQFQFHVAHTVAVRGGEREHRALLRQRHRGGVGDCQMRIHHQRDLVL